MAKRKETFDYYSGKAIKDRRGVPCYQETERERKARAKRRKENIRNIEDIAIAAQKEGLSYGQYVAKYGL